MRYSEPSSVSVIHWCPEIEGEPSRRIGRVGRDEESAIAAWNRRAVLPPSDTAQAPQAGERRDAIQWAIDAAMNFSGPRIDKVLPVLKAMLDAAPVAPAARDHWRQLYESAMKTLAPAFDYIQTHQEQFGANAGDCKMAVISEVFPRLASAAAAQPAESATATARKVAETTQEVARDDERAAWATSNDGTDLLARVTELAAKFDTREGSYGFTTEGLFALVQTLLTEARAASPQATVKGDDMRTAPYANCWFRQCDLPGQRRGEGKCHHPRAAVSQAGATLSEDVLMRAIADTAGCGHTWASRALSDYRASLRSNTGAPIAASTDKETNRA
ncbi:hypothetical protein FSB64_21960 [Paraburkholderia sp. JPY454]|uniref:Uncharacterized protein n=2 Tax=Paraburkholderia youngii TaxID=2782701 RepID=A0ABX2NPJ1_9BURK|nr:hypothetical protein [Paraburkholderia youngii]NVI06384.1 hypothetical protein [Paraburkholderia youngii]